MKYCESYSENNPLSNYSFMFLIIVPINYQVTPGLVSLTKWEQTKGEKETFGIGTINSNFISTSHQTSGLYIALKFGPQSSKLGVDRVKPHCQRTEYNDPLNNNEAGCFCELPTKPVLRRATRPVK